MRRMSILIGIVAVLALGIFMVFFLESEVPLPPGSSPGIKMYRKTALGGLTRVVDTNSGQFLFMYLPEYDRHVHPIKIEKLDDRHWQVVFEAPQN
jgi:hypothetical protein